MYCANETVTLVQFDRVGKQYVCTVISGVSWSGQYRRRLNSTNETAEQSTIVRIPEREMPTGVTIRKDDFVCRGAVSGIDRRADLERYERFCVSELRDNRRGRNLRHWAVIGS